MALLKDVPLPIGITAGYWVITGCQSYFYEQQADVTLFAYTNPEAIKPTPPQPLTSRLIRIPLDPVIDPPETISDLRTPLYEALDRWLADNPDDPLHGATNDGLLP